MVVAVLAILKTGAAYLPLDPGFPADRLEFMQHRLGRRHGDHAPTSASPHRR